MGFESPPDFVDLDSANYCVGVGDWIETPHRSLDGEDQRADRFLQLHLAKIWKVRCLLVLARDHEKPHRGILRTPQAGDA